MNKKMDLNLKIDPEFERVCPPLLDEEFQQLRENILEDREIYMPIMVWDGIIIDGHNRYRILQEDPDIVWTTRNKSFESRDAVLAWICKNQLGRRNLTQAQKKYLIGQQYEAEKRMSNYNGNRFTSTDESRSVQNEHSYKTRKRVAEETHTSESYVMRAAPYAKGVDAAEEALPGIRQEILSGTIKPTDAQVVQIAKALPEERKALAENLRVPKPEKPRRSRKEIIESHRQTQQIYQEMLNQDKEVSSESALVSVEGAVEALIRVCKSLFRDFPQLLTDADCKAQVNELLQEATDFINEVKQEDYSI